MAGQTSICIHGHFYQPPRENPWIEEIDPQSSADPFHDWNERIYHECYLPNVASRIYDDNGRILDIVNNFEKISFNIGPTLMNWLRDNHPNTYQRIIEADMISREHFSGHGNAIAQVYNHAIMPYADLRDKRTQIRWGLTDFEFHFGRKAESIWLAETACDMATLKVLEEEGVRFVILAPGQAQEVRSLEGGVWQDVSSGSIDPKFPYRCFVNDERTRHIDIFFYDGPISKAVGFDDLLKDSKHWMHRLSVAGGSSSGLVSLATDGETFGHHKKYGDRAVAYLTRVEIPQSGCRVTNFGEFLDKNPPVMEVRIQRGPDGLGTSWSCAHGVRRWSEHCGCRGDGPVEWTQHWRKPLREAFDWLKKQSDFIFRNVLSAADSDPDVIRDQYVEVILNRNLENIERFLNTHIHAKLTHEDQIRVFKALEMQRNTLLMFTSCAWFFTDSSGIETVQNLRYACRVIELIKEIEGKDLEPVFMEHLEKIPCNHSYFKSGADIYRKEVLPSRIKAEQVVAAHVIDAIFQKDQPMNGDFSLHSFDIEVSNHRREVFGDIQLDFGKAAWQSRVTLEKKSIVFALLQIGRYDFRFSYKGIEDESDFQRMEAALLNDLTELHMVDLMRRLDDLFGKEFYSLKDLPVKDKMSVIRLLTSDAVNDASQAHSEIFEEHRRIIQVYKGLGLVVPDALRHSAEYAMNERLLIALEVFFKEGFSESAKKVILTVLKDAEVLAIKINFDKAERYLEDIFFEAVSHFVVSPDREALKGCYELLELSRSCGIDFDLRASQERMYRFIKNETNGRFQPILKTDDDIHMLRSVLTSMEFEPERLIAPLLQSI